MKIEKLKTKATTYYLVVPSMVKEILSKKFTCQGFKLFYFLYVTSYMERVE